MSQLAQRYLSQLAQLTLVSDQFKFDKRSLISYTPNAAPIDIKGIDLYYSASF